MNDRFQKKTKNIKVGRCMQGFFKMWRKLKKGLVVIQKLKGQERESIKGNFCFWMTEGGSMKLLKESFRQKRRIMSLV